MRRVRRRTGRARPLPGGDHYKGSGFYTTDYGKGKAAKKDGGEGGGSSSSDAPKTESKPVEKKPAASSGDS